MAERLTLGHVTEKLNIQNQTIVIVFYGLAAL